MKTRDGPGKPIGGTEGPAAGPVKRAERSGYCLLAAVLFRLTDLTAFRVGLRGRSQESGGGEEVSKSGKAGHDSLQWRRGKWVPTAC